MLLAFFAHLFSGLLGWLEQYYLRWTQLPQSSPTLASTLGLSRPKPELLLENALLRQQLLTLRVQRQVNKPRLTRTDRFSLLFPASHLSSWKQALLILKPDTLFRWNRQGFQLFWHVKTCTRLGRPRLSQDLVPLIQQMATQNPSWGAERLLQA